MSSRGSLQRKCVKGHPKAAGKCSGRCIRYYPRLELPRGPDGTRRFEALGGYPRRVQKLVHAACRWYSWSSPPRRSRRCTRHCLLLICSSAAMSDF
jgi:hypothetical protein